jgi:hypothetical protein
MAVLAAIAIATPAGADSRKLTFEERVEDGSAALEETPAL